MQNSEATRKMEAMCRERGEYKSITKAREGLRDLLRETGQAGRGITDKSFKMLGVTRMMEAGATADEAAIHGRWKTASMPLRYKHNSDEYKQGLAGKIPTD